MVNFLTISVTYHVPQKHVSDTIMPVTKCQYNIALI